MAPDLTPKRAAGLLSELEANVSTRIARRVKDAPGMAEGWAWTVDGACTEVRVDDVIVRLLGAVVTAGGATCTCLMAPRCVHVLAVVSLLAEADPADVSIVSPVIQPPSAGDEPADVSLVSAPPCPTTAPQRALSTLLALGAHGADAVVRAELTRVAYEARSDGQHRLGRALTRVVRELRLLQADHPSFALATLVEDTREALTVARGLAIAPTPDLLGEARRSYAPMGTLRLWGLVSEPVLAGTGQTGVVTWLVDARGGRWNIADVRPRPSGQAIGVYDVAPPVTTLSHRKLCREGLFVQNATAADGRIGAGAAVAAVRATGSGWGASPLDALWTVRSTAASRAAVPSPSEGGRGAADELRFVDGVILGLWRDGLLVRVGGADVVVLPGSEHTSLPWRDNLNLLGRAPGLAVRLVGRTVPNRARTLVGLGVASEGLLLPPDWAGRVNLGLDRLTTAHLPERLAEPVRVKAEVQATSDPLAPLRRRVERAMLGGTASLPGEAFAAIAADVGRLRNAAAPGAAALLAALADAAVVRGGEAATLRFAEAWLAGATYLAAVDGERVRALDDSLGDLA